MVSVAIFDYGAGNIFSLKNSLEQAGASVDVITSFDKPNVYSGLLLPGVGNFENAIVKLKSSGFYEILNHLVIEEKKNNFRHMPRYAIIF